jgi:hypothetical protein
VDFLDILPSLQPWVTSLSEGGLITLFQQAEWLFPVVQSFHLLALATLGGCVLILNLRLMGVGMTSESPALIEKNLRPFLWAAIAVLIITGLLMGAVVAQRLYSRPAFFIKMLSLAAALFLSLGVVGSVARNGGLITQPAKIMAGVALAIWLFAISIFATTYGPAPGTQHIVYAAWLITMAFGSKSTRIILGAISAVWIVVHFLVTFIIWNPSNDYDLVMEIDRWSLRCFALTVTGFMLWEFAGPKSDQSVSPKLTRLIGLLTILVWVTVAASGRWIGLGGGDG